MEKRALIAIGLSIAIIVIWQTLFPPPERPQVAPPEVIESAAQEAVDSAASADTRLPDADEPEPDEPPAEAVGAAAEEEVVLETDRVRVVLTNRGGRVKSWALKQYPTPSGEPVDLVPCVQDSDPDLPLEIDLQDTMLADEVNRALFRWETRSAYDGDREGTTAELRYADGRGLEVVKSLTVWNGTYVAAMDVEVIDRGRAIPVAVTWGPGFQAKGSGAGGRVQSYYNYKGQVLWNVAGAVTRIKGHKVENDATAGRVIWAGLDDQYFTALMIPESDESRVRAWATDVLDCPEGDDPDAADEFEPAPAARVAVSVPTDGLLLFVGPKQYSELTAEGHQLGRAVWFATNGMLAAIAKALFLALLWIHDNVVANYGLAIILATLALRIILFPLNQFSMVRMKRAQMEMARLQPKINQIKNRYKKKKDAESRAKLNQETMELYKKEGVSPMGGVVGCLPLLAQFPILIGFYNMLTVAIELRGAPFFGWIQDLSLQDPFYVLPILMGVSMFVQQKMAATKVTDPAQQQQQKIMMIMPFFFTYICIQMPSGMVLYWFVNNLLGILQQWLVNRHTSKLESAASKA